MKTSIKTIVTFAIAGLMSANVALAKNNGGNHGNNNGGNNHGNSGFKISLGGPPKQDFFKNNNNNNKNDCHDGHCEPKYQSCHNQPYYGQNYGQNYGQPILTGRAYEPFHSTYTVLPGDSFYEVSLKEYGTSSAANYIAQFNRMPSNAALVPGQTLMLPSVSASGILSASRALAGQNIYGTQGPVTQNFVSTALPNVTNSVSLAKPVVEEARPKVTVGSTLLVDGQTFGDKPGVARLRVGGLSLPIEVIEWTTSAVKIRLPQVELTSSTKADIEVLRADSTLASKTGIELGAATEQVALTK